MTIKVTEEIKLLNVGRGGRVLNLDRCWVRQVREGPENDLLRTPRLADVAGNLLKSIVLSSRSIQSKTFKERMWTSSLTA